MFNFLKSCFQKYDEIESVDEDMQNDIDTIDFDSIYKAENLSHNMKYSFVATIKGQRWRVFPNGQSPKLISR